MDNPACTLDNVEYDCAALINLLQHGSAAIAPPQTYVPVYAQDRDTGQHGYVGFAKWNSQTNSYNYDVSYEDRDEQKHKLNIAWGGRQTEYVNVISSDPVTGGGNSSDPVTKADDKLKNNELPDVKDSLHDDCHKKGEALRDVFKSVRRRRVELDPSTESYGRHVDVWAFQKNVLNKIISNFRDNNCDDKDLPPGSSLKAAEFEAVAKAPAARGFRQQINRGVLVPVAVGVATATIWLPVEVITAIISALKTKPVPIPAH